MLNVSLEEQIEILKGLAGSYMMLAKALKEKNCKYDHYVLEGIKCCEEALKLELTLKDLNDMMMAA